MKNFFFTLLTLFVTNIFAQFQDRFFNTNNQQGGNFYDIQAKANAYFAATPDTSESGGQNEFKRWELFWSTRINSSDSSTNGTFMPALKALYAAMQTPVCTSSPYVANWNNIGPGLIPIDDQALGMVSSVAFDPVDPANTFYAGTPNSGLWKTSDAGLTWVSLTETLYLPGLGVMDIAIDPQDNKTIYIATGLGRFGSYGLGVLKTTNGGLNWSSTGLSFDPANPATTAVTNKLLIDPVNPNIVYACADDKLYKTSDGGTTWPSIFQLPTSNFFPPASPPSPCQDKYHCTTQTRKLIDMEMKPGDPKTLYISSDDMGNAANAGCVDDCYNITASGSNGGAELWKTTNGGDTWTELTAVTTGSSALFASHNNIKHTDRILIAVSPAEPASIFLCYEEYSNFITTYFQKSTDGGSTWQTAIEANNYTFHESKAYPPISGFLEVSPTNADVIYMGGTVMFKSISGGAYWDQITNTSPSYHNLGGHVDIRAMAIINNNSSDALLMGNDGGVGYTANGAAPWTNVSKALPITQFYGLAGTEKNENLIVAGAQDNGLFTFLAGNWSYQADNVGDAYDCAFDNNDPNICYGEADYNGNTLNKSINGGESWQTLTNKPSGVANLVRPITVNPLDDNIYIGYHDVWKSLSSLGGQGWTKISDFTTNFVISSNAKLAALAVAPSNPKVIYAAYFSDKFFHTTTGGSIYSGAWQISSAWAGANAWAPVTDIEVNPNNEAELWVTLGGFGTSTSLQRVIHSVDYGVNWNDYSTNLPVFPVNKIVYEKGSNDALYVGTDVGVFYRNKSMSQWECFTNNLPVCVVTDLEINYATNTIRASTFGRGLWSAPLACPLNIDDTESSSYSSDAFIEAENNIYSTATDGNFNVTYRAGNQVDLQRGFSASGPNANFHAFIHGCDHSGNSFQRYSNNNSGKSGANNSIESLSLSDNTNKKSEKKKDCAELRVQPNPNNGTITLNVLNSFNPDNTVEISDLTGRKVFSKNFIKQQETLDLNLENGTYLIKYYDGINAHSQMIIINK